MADIDLRCTMVVERDRGGKRAKALGGLMITGANIWMPGTGPYHMTLRRPTFFCKADRSPDVGKIPDVVINCPTDSHGFTLFPVSLRSFCRNSYFNYIH